MRYCLRDRRASRIKDLTELLAKLEWIKSEQPEVIIVHGNTDALAEAELQEILAAGNLYIEYTGATVPWKQHTENAFYGSFDALKRRLRLLPLKASREQVTAVLKRYDSDLSESHITALAVLCQGFLAVWAAVDDGKNWSRIGERDLLDEMGWIRLKSASTPRELEFTAGLLERLREQRRVVCDVGWWLRPFTLTENENQDPLEHEETLAVLQKSLDTEWRIAEFRQVTEGWDDVLALLKRIGNVRSNGRPLLGDDNFPQIVANAYRSLSDRLARE